jgi:hypothetical protein
MTIPRSRYVPTSRERLVPPITAVTMPFSLALLRDVFAIESHARDASRDSKPILLTADELACLAKGERLVIGDRDGFVVASKPGDPGHPVIEPSPDSVFANPPMDQVFRDRRRVRREPPQQIPRW